ncbi:class I SAM-dependent methyltransferase [Octadecabacter sp.]|nr:class I SAM-dependent methyltransferase [Octadecabacter sp.]
MNLLRKLKIKIRAWKLARRTPQSIFSGYFNQNKWGDPESRSGKGSNLASTAELRPKLEALIDELGAKSFLDVPCGDYFWMQHVEKAGVAYTGGDIVPELIAENQARFGTENVQFEIIDLIAGPVPAADIIFVRDCLVHLSNEHVAAALANIRASGGKYLLTTVFVNAAVNEDISTGQWRELDVRKAPFNLPEPERLIDEGAATVRGQRTGKMLGLWKLSELKN